MAQEEIGHLVANKLLGFITTGGTALSVNLPKAALGPPGAFRTGYFKRHVPGVLACINHLLADAVANVIGQSLSTRGEGGYVVTDTDVAPGDAAPAELRWSPQTVWLRSWRA